VSQLQNELKGSKKLMLCGFGVGMSWATAQIQVEDCEISDLVEL
jgi:3-oxoacyl-[acyl-carrier-protein] synthase-3